MTRLIALAIACAALATGAAAQTPPKPPAFSFIKGDVTDIRPQAITVAGPDGAKTTAALSPEWYAVAVRPVDIDAIKPGSFIASANMQQANGDGRSLEIRMLEPGSKLGEGNRPMDSDGKMMTNATVSKVSKGAGGRELMVEYPGGSRKIIVPPGLPVIASFPAERSIVKPGANITALAIPDEAGKLEVTRVSVSESAAP